MKSIELFSGCGGLAYGLSEEGFHHEVLVEINSDAVATINKNREIGESYAKDWKVVGKADPANPSAQTPKEQGDRLYRRLADHYRMIQLAQNYQGTPPVWEKLNSDDFFSSVVSYV